jgi:ABC-type multidrug transport system ATPase subunit
MTSEILAIEVSNLTKIYDKVPVVNNLSFNVKKGEVFGFLGPNGAGKTTTIKSILGLVHKNSGTIKINGVDVSTDGKQIKKLIGYLPERVAFYDNLTALQNLYFYAEMKNVTKGECIKFLIEFGLKEHAHKKVGNFSHGMIQRLGMARAMLGNPPILVLDEPTGGLDPRGVKLIREKINELNKKGVTIFVSSHILSEIQAVADQVVIIDKGILLAQNSVNELSKQLDIKPILSIDLEIVDEKIINAIKEVEGVERVNIKGNTIEISCSAKTRAKVIVAADKNGAKIKNLQTKEPDLEEIFMRFTEEEAK